MSMNDWSDAIASAAPATTDDMNFAVTQVLDRTFDGGGVAVVVERGAVDRCINGAGALLVEFHAVGEVAVEDRTVEVAGEPDRAHPHPGAMPGQSTARSMQCQLKAMPD